MFSSHIRKQRWGWCIRNKSKCWKVKLPHDLCTVQIYLLPKFNGPLSHCLCSNPNTLVLRESQPFSLYSKRLDLWRCSGYIMTLKESSISNLCYLYNCTTDYSHSHFGSCENLALCLLKEISLGVNPYPDVTHVYWNSSFLKSNGIQYETWAYIML